jgi:predicted transcriptional regulator
MERRILDDVLAHAGTAQAAVAARLGLSRQALHYHVKKLEARGLLSKTPEGRETRCEVTPLGRAALAAVQLGSEEKP